MKTYMCKISIIMLIHFLPKVFGEQNNVSLKMQRTNYINIYISEN